MLVGRCVTIASRIRPSVVVQHTAQRSISKMRNPPTIAMEGVWSQVVAYQRRQMLPDELQLAEEIEAQPRSVMMGEQNEAHFLGWLCETIGAERVIEVGVFRGSTTLRLARSLPDGGKVVALDLSDQYVEVGKKYWEAAGMMAKIDFRVGPALASMDAMIHDGESGKYDLCFIDADKANYWNYFERALQLVRRGGVIAVDNVLWHGRTLKPPEEWDEDTSAIASINERLLAETRVKISLLPIADGITLCRVL